MPDAGTTTDDVGRGPSRARRRRRGRHTGGGPDDRPGGGGGGGDGDGEPTAVGPPWTARRTTWLLLAVTALPFLASAIAIFAGVGGTYRPYADVALTELVVRDIGRYEVLVGPYSRDGWHHPGPALFYLLAVPYRLLGSSPAAMAAGALLVNFASIAGIAAIAKRRGGVPFFLCTLVTLGLLVRSLGFDFLVKAWNPYITVLPYGLLVMLVWAMACRERWAVPAAVVVASFVVQTHVGYVALALPLLGLGAAWLVLDTLWGARRDRRPASAGGADESTASAGDALAAGGPGSGGLVATGPEPVGAHADDADTSDAMAGGAGADRAAVDGTGAGGGLTAGTAAGAGASLGAAGDGAARGRGLRGWARRGWRGSPVGRLVGAGLVAAGLGALAWVLPIVEQLRTGDGNMTIVARWFQDHEGEARTLGLGWRVVSAQYALSAEWLFGWADRNMLEEPVYVEDPLVPVLLVLVGLAVVVGWRRLGADGRKLVAVWLVASAVGVVAAARTIGPLYAYRLGWAWTLGAIAGAYVLWVGWTFVADRWPARERRVLVPVAVAAVATLAVVDVVVAAQAGTPEQDVSAVLNSLSTQAYEALPEGDGEVVVSPTSFLTLGYGVGFALQLEQDGNDIGFRVGGQLGAHRAPGGRPLRAELVMAADADILTQMQLRPELELVAQVGDMSFEDLEADLAERERIEERIRAEGPGALADPSPELARKSIASTSWPRPARWWPSSWPPRRTSRPHPPGDRHEPSLVGGRRMRTASRPGAIPADRPYAGDLPSRCSSTPPG